MTEQSTDDTEGSGSCCSSRLTLDVPLSSGYCTSPEKIMSYFTECTKEVTPPLSEGLGMVLRIKTVKTPTSQTWTSEETNRSDLMAKWQDPSSNRGGLPPPSGKLTVRCKTLTNVTLTLCDYSQQVIRDIQDNFKTVLGFSWLAIFKKNFKMFSS